MTSKTQEIIDQTFEQFGNKLPPHLEQELKTGILNMIEKGAAPKDVVGVTNEFIEFGYKYGYNLFQAGKYVMAAKVFEALSLLDPSDTRFNLGAAACYHQLGDFSGAAACYALFKANDPLNPIPCFHLYDCLMKLNKPAVALLELERTILLAERDPRYQLLKERALLEKQGLLEHFKTHLDEKTLTLKQE